MRTINIIIIFFSFVLWLTACSKDNAPAPLPEGSVVFQQAIEKDTIEIPLSILKDSAVVVALKAKLSGTTAAADHWVSFSVDTTKIADYRSRFGNATMMPSGSYFFTGRWCALPQEHLNLMLHRSISDCKLS